jgi:hydroxymethylpyrimidine pyrophosphatase-like HAD family hydrolase
MNYVPEIVDFKALEDYTAIKVITHEHSTLLELRDRIVANHSHLFSHAFSLPHCLEFMDKSVDKMSL